MIDGLGPFYAVFDIGFVKFRADPSGQTIKINPDKRPNQTGRIGNQYSVAGDKAEKPAQTKGCAQKRQQADHKTAERHIHRFDNVMRSGE